MSLAIKYIVSCLSIAAATSFHPVEVNPTPTARETQMIDEINSVRTNPSGYATYIQDYIVRTKADKPTVAAANELISVLKKLQPLGKLKFNAKMYRDAKAYGQKMVKRNLMQHSDLPYNENLSFGIENIRDVIVDLLIDADIADRGHRNNILNPDITLVAVNELDGKVDGYSFCYIQEFR